jgi:multiple sugar transport system substrate-binding protein
MNSRNLSRREFLRLGALGTAGLALAGCVVPTPLPTSAPAEAPASTPAPTPAPEPVTIRYWRHFTPSEEEVTKELVEEFKEVEPSITVEYEPIPDNEYYPKLNTALAADEAADVFAVYTQMWESYFRKGVMAPVVISAFGYSGVDEMLEQHFKPGSMDFAVKDGQLYAPGMPEYGTWAEAYNQECFDKAGISYPAEDTGLTWEEYFQQAVELTLRDADGNMTQMGDGQWFTSMDNPFGCAIILDPMFKQLGGDAFDEASGQPTNKETWQQIAQLMYDCSLDGKYGYVDPGFPSSTNAHPEVFSGRIAQVPAGPWAVGWGISVNPDLKLGFYPLPAVDDEHNAAINVGWVWTLNAASSPEQQMAGSQWIDFLSSVESAEKLYDAGGLVQPLRSEEYDNHMIEQLPAMELFLREAARAKNPAWGDMGTERWDILRKMAEAIFKTGEAPDAAVETAWSAMEAIAT